MNPLFGQHELPAGTGSLLGGFYVAVALLNVGGAALAFTTWRLGVSLPATARSSGLPPLGAIHGAAWAAGSMFGVAMGLGWARSFLHHEDEDAPAASARRRVSSVAGDGAG